MNKADSMFRIPPSADLLWPAQCSHWPYLRGDGRHGSCSLCSDDIPIHDLGGRRDNEEGAVLGRKPRGAALKAAQATLENCSECGASGHTQICSLPLGALGL